MERSFAWTTRVRRLARDYERLPETLAGLHFVAFAILLAARFVQLVIFLNPLGCGYSYYALAPVSSERYNGGQNRYRTNRDCDLTTGVNIRG